VGVVRRFLELLELVQVQVLASVAVLGCLVLGHLVVVVVVAVVALVRRVLGLLVQVHPLVVVAVVVVTMHWTTWTSSMYGGVEGRRL
jgi:hypothetical protein